MDPLSWHQTHTEAFPPAGPHPALLRIDDPDNLKPRLARVDEATLPPYNASLLTITRFAWG
jgi:hypothetical protein